MNVSGPVEDRELAQEFLPERDEQTLVDLLDRVIDRGVVIAGDVVLSVAGIDLVHLELRLRLQGLDHQVTAIPAGERR
ncbi:MAG: gas vesicle protein [Nitriliruptor sp.]